jgi:dTDP-4-amino-4,6-dideoxygalactose transaminase
MSHNNFLPFALPDIGPEEIEEVVETLKSGWLTTGPRAAKFEQDFADYLGVPFALAVNSCTAGLHLALEAAGIGPGDLIITSPYTFTATAEVVRYLGADILLADIDSQTLNINPQEIEKEILRIKDRERIKSMVPVHFAGQACDMEAIGRLARRFKFTVVEDAAHALPCTYKSKKIGTFGTATVFSFYVTKTLATGEGGMVTTDSEAIADRIKVMRLHGINRDIWDRYTSNKPNWYYEVIAPGFKYNMPDLMAAIGIHQLNKVELFQRRREKIAGVYNEALQRLPLKTPYVADPDNIHAWQLYVIQLELEKLKITRDQFIEKMAEKGIGTSVHFIPLHLHPYWLDRYGYKPEDFPVALESYKRAVSLPIYSKMTGEDVQRVVEAVTDICQDNIY